jgi:NADP-dependent 3-hydroxy acid dehydrogenase YdfG
MPNDEKRLAWVTGGGSGIGEAGAEALAADGWIVVVSGRRKDALDDVAAKITKAGGKAEAIALDVSQKNDANKAAEKILSRHGRIDLLVNSAGINVPKRSWADMELEGWDRLVEINLNGVLYCMHAVLPAMRARKEGCIINVAC